MWEHMTHQTFGRIENLIWFKILWLPDLCLLAVVQWILVALGLASPWTYRWKGREGQEWSSEDASFKLPLLMLDKFEGRRCGSVRKSKDLETLVQDLTVPSTSASLWTHHVLSVSSGFQIPLKSCEPCRWHSNQSAWPSRSGVRAVLHYPEPQRWNAQIQCTILESYPSLCTVSEYG